MIKIPLKYIFFHDYPTKIAGLSFLMLKIPENPGGDHLLSPSRPTGECSGLGAMLDVNGSL